MNGGQVRNLFGGGLHKSEVGTSNVVVNGGKVVSVQGGGAASFSGTTCHRPWYAGNPVDSPNRVNVAKVTIKNITGKGSIVYGGGEGISYTGVTNVVVSGGTWDYVIAGGSNGFTGNATLDITGGTINTVQSVNRGKMDDARIKIAGGTITNAYVGGDTSDKGVTGTIGNADMDIVGGKVTNVSVGTNGVTADGKQIMATDVANLWYHQGLVTNVIEEGFDKDSVAMTVTLTFSAAGYSEGLEIPIGFSFTNEEVRELEQGMHMDLDTLYFTFGGFYKDEACTEKFDFSKPFDQDTTIYMSLVPREEENPEDKTEEPKVENPDTADINLILILATTVFGSLGLTYTIKKRGFN